MYFNYAVTCVAVFCLCLNLRGQVDTIELAEFEVIDSLSFLENSDKSLGNISVSPTLDARINSKENGPENLSTLNFRGGSASQLSVRWNGISISSPMLGQMDASLVPFDLFDEIVLSANANDKANVGLSGDLNLISSLSATKKNLISLQVETKSFNNRTIKGGFNFKTKKYTSTLSLFHKYGLNNFRIPSENSELFQRHSKFKFSGLLWSQEIQLGKRDKVEAHFWAEDRNSQLPPHVLQNRSQSIQYDNFVRSQLIYSHQQTSGLLSLQIAYAADDNHFIDSLNLIDALNHFKQYDLRISNEKQFQKNWNFSGNFALSQQEGSSQNYSEKRIRRIAESNLRLEKVSKKWNASFIWGGLYVDSLNNSFSFQYAYHLNNSLSIQGIVSRNFRLPSLNELYWRPGGNNALNTENATSYELKLKQTFQSNKLIIRPEISTYFRETSNWILWSFDTSSSFWSAQNITEVQTKGIDLRIPALVRINSKIQNKLDITCAFISSQFQNSLVTPKIEKGDQIYYTPKFALGLFNELKVSTFSFEIAYSMKTKTQGTLYTIEDYSLIDLALKKRIFPGNSLIEIALAMQNALNTRYEMVERRPLPGRHYTLNIKINFFRK